MAPGEVAELAGGSCDVQDTACGDGFVARISAGGPGVTPAVNLTVDTTAVARGGTLTATWAGNPTPTANDYLRLFTLGSEDAEFDDPFIYWPTPGAAAGQLQLLVPADLAEGWYELRLLSRLAPGGPDRPEPADQDRWLDPATGPARKPRPAPASRPTPAPAGRILRRRGCVGLRRRRSVHRRRVRTGRGMCLDAGVGLRQRDLHVRAQRPRGVRGSGASRLDRWPTAAGLRSVRLHCRHDPSPACAPASPSSRPDPQRVDPPRREPAENRLGRLRRGAEGGAPRHAGPRGAVARDAR